MGLHGNAAPEVWFIGNRLVALAEPNAGCKADPAGHVLDLILSVYCREDSESRRVGCSAQSQWNATQHRVLAWYARSMVNHFGAAYCGNDWKCARTVSLLLLGVGGGGIIDQLLHDRRMENLRISAVDNEAEAIRCSSLHARPSHRVSYIHADAFNWALDHNARYHCIMNDLFELVPETAMSSEPPDVQPSFAVEFLCTVSRLLVPGGLYLHAIIGCAPYEQRCTKRLASYFTSVEARRRLDNGSGVNSFLFICVK